MLNSNDFSKKLILKKVSGKKIAVNLNSVKIVFWEKLYINNDSKKKEFIKKNKKFYN